jgi:hypothetical protein
MKRSACARLTSLILGALLAALWLAAPVPARQDGETGSLEFIAVATPSGGRPTPALRLPFYLLRKSFADIQKEAEAEVPPPALDEFIDSLEASPELKAWMKTNKTAQLTGADFIRSLKVKDIFDVPEFLDAYLARNALDTAVGFPKPKHRESDKEKNPEKYAQQKKSYLDKVRRYLETYAHTKDGIDQHLIEINPAQRWAQKETSRQQDVRFRSLELAQTRYLVAKTETDLAGRAGFVRVPPGQYWLSSLDGETVAGDVRLRWDTPVEIGAGAAARLELNNLNAFRKK